MNDERFLNDRLNTSKVFVIVLDFNSCLCQLWVVVGLEGIKMFSIGFGSSITSVQLVFKIDHYFRNDRVVVVARTSNLNSSDEVLLTVCSNGSDRQLAPCEYDRFG